jgi:hypothetical protein
MVALSMNDRALVTSLGIAKLYIGPAGAHFRKTDVPKLFSAWG